MTEKPGDDGKTDGSRFRHAATITENRHSPALTQGETFQLKLPPQIGI